MVKAGRRCTSSSSSTSSDSEEEPTTSTPNAKNETAMLTAARYGITEMMTAILGKFPVAVNDVDADKKNIVLIAVETRQLEPYNILLSNYIPYNVP
ncbi:hypothetical protein TIFTF001_048995 [Ficus carica]|uniref:Uncharacterized protein n=1 Tax=Ficus carica TaxID=3494 RepID=A0AA87Z1Z5_FICCA|nr:hypothetical protein TIFTF001_048995 [Ficus carica]